MMKAKEIFQDLYWVGSLNPELRTFHYFMPTESGTSYNAYVLKGSNKIAMFETVKEEYFNEFIEKLQDTVSIKEIDYIIVDRIEPDCAGPIEKLLDRNPELKLVGSVTTLNYIQEICNRQLNTISVKDSDTLSLGNKTLRFFSIPNQDYSRSQKRRWNNKITTLTIPNFQWLDTICVYIEEDHALITSDSFSSHYSCQDVTSDKIQNQEEFQKALKNYYRYTMEPYKAFIRRAIEKIQGLKIDTICPGHGPVITKEANKVIANYKEWSMETKENLKKIVTIPYVSVYGHTRIIAEKIAEGIHTSGDIDVKMIDLKDLDKEKMNEILDVIKFADGILLGLPTIRGEAPKVIWDLVTSMYSSVHGKKLASAFGSYGWSGEGVPHMISRLYDLNMKVYKNGFRVRLKPNEIQLKEAFDFGYGFGLSVLKGKILNDKEISYHSVEILECFDTEERIIIIGNGAAGTTACEEVRKRNRKCSIELISKESFVGYNRMMLSEGILSEISNEKILLHPEEWYKENHISFTLNIEVKEINPGSRTIFLSDGSEKNYDKLILATGSEAFIPPIDGIDKEGVFTVHSLAEVNDMRNYMKSGVNNVTIIGGGIMGLEIAWELRNSELNITILEKSPIIMDNQLDEKAAEFLLRAVENAGIHVVTGVEIEEIFGRSNVAGIKLSNGEILDTQLIILSAGVKKNVELADHMGIQVGHSIVVNERMETCIKDIYACGDCAEYKGINYTLWSQAVEMATVAAINVVGGNAIYNHSEPSISFTGMNTSLFSIGDNGKNPNKKYITKEHCDEEHQTYEKLYFANGRFCGGILLGDVNKAGELVDAFYERKLISQMYL